MVVRVAFFKCLVRFFFYEFLKFLVLFIDLVVVIFCGRRVRVKFSGLVVLVF